MKQLRVAIAMLHPSFAPARGRGLKLVCGAGGYGEIKFAPARGRGLKQKG